MSNYDRDFYEPLVEGAEQSAEVVVPIVLELVPVTSVCDVGCGTGIWLDEFRHHGITDIRGYDGDYVPRDLLRIPPDRFFPIDLTQPLDAGRTFDLAVSLEVAEHLPPESAASFVKGLTRLSPIVLFSAAIPNQGGTEHLNERWQDYWAEVFLAHGYRSIDAIRWRIWDNDDVELWYRQNMFLCVSEAVVGKYPKLTAPVPVESLPRSVIHPRAWEPAPPRPAGERRTKRRTGSS
jgi:SAM-dependent methyltransferase